MRGPVKTLIALALLAVLGFAVAGCGSGKKGGSATLAYSIGSTPATIKVTGSTAVIPNVKAGTPIACKGMGIRVTAPATGAIVTAHHQGKKLRIRRLPGGSIRVSCTSTQ